MAGDKLKAIISIEKVIFYKNNWGIVLASVDKIQLGKPEYDRNSFITIKGNMPEPKDGMQYYIKGTEINDPKFGLQYELSNMSSVIDIDTNDKTGQKKYLLKLFTPGQVKSMYEALDNPFEVLENEDTAKLIQVKGCGINNAILWIDRFRDNYSFSKIYIELEYYNLTHNMIKRLMGIYKSADLVIEKVKNNPYTLCECKGIGWKTADKIAMDGGMDQYCFPRVESFIRFYLEQVAQDGMSYVNPNELMDAICENIGEDIPDLVVTDAIHDMDDLWYNEDKTKIGLTRYRKLEENIAKELHRLVTAENTFDYSHWEETLEQLEKEQGWKHTEEQRKSIYEGLISNVIVIEGLAGTGKSTSAKGITETLKNYMLALCALSGRAAARIAEITGEEGYTIHRLLGFPCKSAEGKNSFTYHDENPLPYDIIIIDEISMIGGRLFYYLLRAIKTGAKVILLGDIGQLESIGECNIAYDMIKSKHVPSFSLTQIHRQAAKSAIITESIKLRKGIQIIDKDWTGVDVRGELKDLELVCYSDKSNTYYKTLEYFNRELPLVNSILDIQVITPVKNNGDSCTYSLNNAIQDLYNPSSNKKKEITIFTNGKPYIMRVGDKVINRKNNYHALKPNGDQGSIFNGDIGIVRDIDDSGKIMMVDFVDKGTFALTNDQLSFIELAYAITCHSMQGSQAERIIVAIDFSSYVLLTKELLYTAITRAQKHCTLIAQNGALRFATSKEGVNIKNTHLQECLEKVFAPPSDRIIF